MNELANLAFPDVRDRGDLLVVPLGATEQHGPHLPLGTDTTIAAALAGGLVLREPRSMLAPPLAFGASGEHRGFAGTVSIGQEALELVLVELARSACETFDHLLFVNAHGGNAGALGRALMLLAREGRRVRAWSPSQVWNGDAHAGEVETSLMLALCPGRVHLHRAMAGNTRPLSELMPLLVSGGVRAASHSGVLGDPSGASADHGERLLEAGLEALCEYVASWLDCPGQGA